MAFTRPKASQIDFDITNITDPLIRLNSGETGSADKDVGIVIERGDDTNVAIIYDESADQFVLVNTTETGTTSGNVTISSYAGLQADAIVYGSLNDGTTTLTATVAELNILDGVTATATELNYVDGVTSAIQTQLDAKLALAGGTMSGAIAMGTNKITGMGDPTANQDAATKAYVDTQTSSIVTTTDIAGDTGTDTVTLGSDTLTFTGGQGVSTTVTDNTVTITTSGASPDIELDSAVGDNSTTDFSVTTAPTAAEDLLVTINGIVQRPTTDYTVSGTTVTFGTAPFTGAVVAARTITAASTGPELSADTTPQLGGNLDLNSNDITGTGNVNITGTVTAETSSTGEFNGITIHQATNSSGDEARIQFKRTTDAGSNREVAAIVADRVGGNDTALVFETNTDGSDGATERVRINQDGNVGINTTTMDAGLNIKQSADNAYQIKLEQHNTTDGYGLICDMTDGALAFSRYASSAYTERMRIDSSGNVGIGTTSPVTALEIQTTNKLGSTFTGTTNGEGLTVTQSDYTAGNYVSLVEAAFDDSGNANPNVRIGAKFDGSGSSLAFGTSSSYVSGITNTAMLIDRDGKVLVGTTTAAGTFDGTGTEIQGGTIYLNTTGVPLELNQTTNDAAARSMIRFFRRESQVGSITSSTSATAYNTSSDYRLKENVTATWDATTRLKQLNPVRFNFIADADTTVDGFLAHEVQSVVPEAITGTHNEVDDNGNPVYQGIDQSKLVPLLVKTIQELEARIVALENP